jgi:Zn-dependent M28 family amino/carboxypeptidase
MAFGRIRAVQGPVLIRLDPVHAELFNQFAGYLSQPAVVTEVDTNRLAVWVVSDQDVKKISVHVRNKVAEIEMANVVGILPGKSKPDEIVMFSAHYDHLGRIAAVDGDEIANGADDNASGTTAIITLADYFKRKGNHERTLMFVAFTAEEKGLIGSTQFAQQFDAARLVAGINVEMIGKPSKFGAGQGFLTGFERGTLGKILQANLEGTEYMIHPDPYPQQRLFMRSDNAPFARKGVPAHTISSTQVDSDPHYHKVSDELETLDLDHLTEMITIIARATESLVEGRDTPERLQ